MIVRKVLRDDAEADLSPEHLSDEPVDLRIARVDDPAEARLLRRRMGRGRGARRERVAGQSAFEGECVDPEGDGEGPRRDVVELVRLVGLHLLSLRVDELARDRRALLEERSHDRA